jgi:hypothetical protein
MSYNGPPFDGEDSDPIITLANIQSAYYNASDPENQYRTSGQNLDLVAANSTPIFSLKNSNGVVQGELRAAKVTLSQASTITTSTGGLTIQNDDQTAGLTVQKSAGTNLGLAAQFTTSSAISPTINILNNSSSSNSGLNVLAPNLSSEEKTQIRIGRDISNNGNSYSISSVYSTTGANQRLEINSFGENDPALQIYKKATTCTSATTGSVVVPGDLTSSTKVSSKELVLYGSTSGSATLKASAVTTPYSIVLPNTLGTNGQVLTLGTPSGGQATTSWNDVSTTVTASGVFAREINPSDQAIGDQVISDVGWTGSASGSNVGTVPISLTSNTTFTNTASYTTAFTITLTLYWKENSQTTGVKQQWVEKSNGERFGFAMSMQTSGIPLSIESSCTVVLASSDTFKVKVWQNTGANVSLIGSSADRCKIQITQVQGTVPSGGGVMQTVAFSTPSSLFSVSGSPTSGANPTITFNTASSPTGSGTQLVLANSPTIATPTLTGTTTASTIESQVLKTNQYVENFLDLSIVAGSNVTLTSSDRHSIRVSGFGANFSITLPNAATIPPGTIYKFYNISADEFFVRNNASTILYTVQLDQAVYFILESNSTTNGTWQISSLLSSRYTVNNTNFTVGAGARLKLTNSLGNGTIQIYPSSSQTTDYDFILPTTPGNNGQVLTSQGSGTRMTWSTPLTNLSVLTLTSTGNSITSTGNLLTLNGSGDTPLRIYNNNTFGGKILELLQPNIGDPTYAQNNRIVFGKSESTQNSVYLNYEHFNDGSNSNNFHIGLYGPLPFSIKIKKADLADTVSIAGGLQVPYISVDSDKIRLNQDGDIIMQASTGNIQTRYGNHVFGDLSYATHDAAPVLKLQATNSTSGNNNPVLDVISQSSTTDSVGLSITNPTLSSSSGEIRFRLGKDLGSYNMWQSSFEYYGTGNIANNLTDGLYNETYSTKTYKNGITATASAATLKVNGGLQASSIYCSGNTIANTASFDSVNVTGNVTANSFTVNLGGGQTRNLTYDYGSATPEFSWKNGTQTVNYNYPTWQGGGVISNQIYRWQQIGAQYSFNLHIKIDITSWNQGNLTTMYIRNVNPPIPPWYADNQLMNTTRPAGIYFPAL